PVRMGRSALPFERESAMKRFEVGARVVEPTYGLGSVGAVEDAYTRVQFDDHGVKRFMTSMSRLEPSNEPVPAGLRTGKPRKKRPVKAKAAPAAAVVEDCRPSGRRALLLFIGQRNPLSGRRHDRRPESGIALDGLEEVLHFHFLGHHVLSREQPAFFQPRKHQIEKLLVVALPRIEEDEIEGSL